MGDIAEMMLEGDMCQYCGTFLGDGDGFPVSCGCDGDDDDVASDYKALKEEKKKRHAKWRVDNMKVIDSFGAPYRMAGTETVLFRQPGKPKVDFYPSTGRWRVSGGGKTHSGGASKFIEWYLKQTI